MTTLLLQSDGELAGLRDKPVSNWIGMNSHVTNTRVIDWSVLLFDWLSLETVQHLPAVNHSANKCIAQLTTIHFTVDKKHHVNIASRTRRLGTV